VAAAKNRGVLDAINYGDARPSIYSAARTAFASGGPVSATPVTYVPVSAAPAAQVVAAAPANVTVQITPKVGGVRLNDLIDVRIEQAGQARKVSLSTGLQKGAR